MNFIYNCARLPKNHRLLIKINNAANRVHGKVMGLDVYSLKISDYGKRYFSKKKVSSDQLRKNLIRECYILSWTISQVDIPLDEFVFIDYGSGNATLSLLAKELGIGTVIYNDLFETSCKDAEIIGKSIGIQADYYVNGDIDDVITFLRDNLLSCDGIASYDVIEHIYDIEIFFSKLHLLSDESLSVFMASGANDLNLKIRKKLMQQQIDHEYNNQEKPWGYKGNDCFEAYLEARKKIINSYTNKLSISEVNDLAISTRGKNETDIKISVDNFLKTNKLLKTPSHPTNTCDPYTGYWHEHLLNPYILKNILSHNGFEKVGVSGGYRYTTKKNILIKMYRNIFHNFIISIFNKYGSKNALRIAPYYCVFGVK